MTSLSQEGRPVATLPALEYIFHPRSIAVIGASEQPDNRGRDWLQACLDMGFRGSLYPVNPNATQVLGLKAYPTVRDIPGPVDHVIFCVPSRLVTRILEDCVAKGVKVAHFFTSGFREVSQEGKDLEQEVLRIARRGGIRIIGPNCMGIYAPGSGIAWRPTLPREAGEVGFFSQSGGNAQELGNLAAARGFRFSKVVSYGNAIDINEADLLEYFLLDPESRVIAGYIEGVRDGPRFQRLLKDSQDRKPILLLKGGETEAGTRAMASHTGSLAGSWQVWQGLCRQHRLVQARDLDEMADLILTFLHFKLPRGRRAVVLGMGGGASVQAADDCQRAGLGVPHLSPEAQRELRGIFPEAGTSIKNPIDSNMAVSLDEMRRAARIAAGSPNIDFSIVNMGLDTQIIQEVLQHTGGRASFEDFAWAHIEGSLEPSKPVAAVFRTVGFPQTLEAIGRLQGQCQKAGIPIYPTIARAASAISKFISYHEDKGP